MKFLENKVEDIKIAYVGGGSRGWAWGLMSDLVSAEDISGDVFLYDIDFEASKHNEIIGNMYNNCDGAKPLIFFKKILDIKLQTIRQMQILLLMWQKLVEICLKSTIKIIRQKLYMPEESADFQER